jgi:hypothetical protein
LRTGFQYVMQNHPFRINAHVIVTSLMDCTARIGENRNRCSWVVGWDVRKREGEFALLALSR